MSNGQSLATQPAANAADEALATVYVPFGEKSEIKLTPALVRKYLARPTKKGKLPDDQTVMGFIMLCRARELNPWAGDAWMVGYDAADGPEFSCITAHQALLKRAEACPAYDGMESGVMVKPKGSEDVIDRQGDFTMESDRLVGAWARVHRSDRKIPDFDRLKFATYNKGMSQWKKDPEGMIVKCAEASCLRKAFPTQLGGLYTSEEYERFGTTIIDAQPLDLPQAPTKLKELTAQLASQQQPQSSSESTGGDTPAGGDTPESPPQEALSPEDAKQLAQSLMKRAGALKDRQQYDALMDELPSTLLSDQQLLEVEAAAVARMESLENWK